jgi:hypothetical protein
MIIFLVMRPPFVQPPPLLRLNPRLAEPADPAAIVTPRPRGTRRPHTDATVAVVRRLIEDTALTYGEIAQRTGVGRASICRWTRDGGWTRHPMAPRATDTVPRPRAGARLKLRTLAARLAALAERHIRELEESACVDPEKLSEALELLKMAKLAARVRRGRRRRTAATSTTADTTTLDAQPASPPFVPAKAGTQERHEPAAPEHYARRAMRTLRAAGVDTSRVPDDALSDFVESHAPPPERHRPRRGRRFTRADYHAWLMTKEQARSRCS